MRTARTKTLRRSVATTTVLKSVAGKLEDPIAANMINDNLREVAKRILAIDDPILIVEMYHLGYIKFKSQAEADGYLDRCRMLNKEKYSYSIIVKRK